jgi:aspartate kinase
MSLEVYKFGGVAMGTPEAIRAAVGRVAAARGAGCEVACVVSAMQGVTDLLLGAGRAAARRRPRRLGGGASRFAARHDEVALALLADAERAARCAPRSPLDRTSCAPCARASPCCASSPRAQDALVSRGERVLAPRLRRRARRGGDRRRLRRRHRRASSPSAGSGSIWPSFPQCARAAQERMRRLLARGAVVVMPGFPRPRPDGELVTLGRGGTDFSAALLARSLDADAVTLWKEVDG